MLQTDYFESGSTAVYAVVRQMTTSGGKLVKQSDASLLDDTTANWPQAKIAGSDAARSQHYIAAEPVGMPAGEYLREWRLQSGDDPDPTDFLLDGPEKFIWDGVKEVSYGDNVIGLGGLTPNQVMRVADAQMAGDTTNNGKTIMDRTGGKIVMKYQVDEAGNRTRTQLDAD